MDDYEKYEADCAKMRDLNKEILNKFKVWLQASNLAERTIKSHLENVDFYINEFLLYESPIVSPEEGISDVSMYLGYWFIKKAMWASKSHIKGSAASLTKFYTCLLGQGLITEHDLRSLKMTIKDEMPEWLETLERYDDLENAEWE